MSNLLTAIQLARSEEMPLILPGATDTITALVIEELGFKAVYVTGAGLANARFGYPDIGLIGLSEVADHVSAMADVVNIPLVVDADTGYGNAINVQRTVRILERAGAAAIQLEDQVSPKRCGHFDGKEIISEAEMVQKIKAAVDARREDTLIIARTDAKAIHGIEEATTRAAAYLEAGADVLFVEAPTTRSELATIPSSVPGLHIVNQVEGGKTPLLGREELGQLGFAIMLYANSAMRASIFGARDVLQHLFDTGSTERVLDRLITWEERQSLVGKQKFEELEKRFTTEKEPRTDRN
ncbi:MAG: isocitrate lyase/PEP mutase family protein [Ferrimicrobium sp.]